MKKELKPITPFKMFIKGYFPFIEDTMEAIDNYDLLCKVVEYLNNVVAQTNNMIDDMNYLLNWFNNLDVQDEINNKLDEMALSGELEDLLRNVRTATSNYISQTYTKKETDFEDVDLLNMDTADFYELWDKLAEDFPEKITSYTWLFKLIIQIVYKYLYQPNTSSTIFFFFFNSSVKISLHIFCFM